MTRGQAILNNSEPPADLERYTGMYPRLPMSEAPLWHRGGTQYVEVAPAILPGFAYQILSWASPARRN